MTSNGVNSYTQTYANLFLQNRNYIGTAPQWSYKSPPFPLSYPFARIADQLSAQTAAMGISSVLKTAQSVRAASEKLMKDSPNSVFRERKADSSDPASVSAEAVKGASLKTHKVAVDRVASAQTNAGYALTSGTTGQFHNGWNSFSISAGGKTKTTSIYVGAGDSNELSLYRLRDTINKSGMGVTANVTNDSKTGTVQMVLRGDETGTYSAFTLKDVTGNAIAVSGANTLSFAAEDASYTIDGGDVQTSQMNDVTIDRGKVSLHLKKAAPEAAVSIGHDTSKIAGAVKQLADRYNDWVDAVQSAGGILNRRAVHGMAQAAGSVFEDVGIDLGADGRMLVDEAKLAKGLKDDYASTERAIGGTSGLAEDLHRASRQINDSSSRLLLNPFGTPLQRYIGYESKAQYIWQVPPQGFLVNYNF